MCVSLRVSSKKRFLFFISLLKIKDETGPKQHLLKDENHLHTKICTQMFITALFIMPKLGSNQDALQ